MSKFYGLVLIGLFCCAGSAAQAQSEPPLAIDCVQQPSQGTCPGGWLRNLPVSAKGSYVTVGGYSAPGDAGGGLFEAGADGSCPTITATTTSGVARGSSTVTVTSTPSISPGMSVMSATSAAILPYDVITNVLTNDYATVITLETPVAASTTSPVTLTIGKDNGGSVIADAETVPRCFYRSSAQYNAKEWGAKEDGRNDDTVALQSWLNTAQAYMPALTKLQPHIAVPGTSIVSFPLICPSDTTIQGPTNLEGSVAVKEPLFTIMANKGINIFPPSSAVIDAYRYCRFGGVGIDGNGVADTVDVYGERVTIDGFSALENGNPYNLRCSLAGDLVGLQIKDSIIESSTGNGIELAGNCHDFRLIGDIVLDAGQIGIHDAGAEGTIADGVIEESQGIGLHLDGTAHLSVGAMHIEGNGLGPLGGAGIEIDNVEAVSICNNHLIGNGGNLATSAQVRFGGTSDGLNLCGNVYEAKSKADVALRPFYVYDAAPGAVLTNTHLYDSPAPQAGGPAAIYSNTAAAILPQLQVPHVALGAISGLALSNGAVPPGQIVNIAPGEASDSGSAATIELAANCPVNLANRGAGGLDTGSVAANTTYFYFLIGNSSGGNTSCMASASSVPAFVNTAYSVNVTGQTQSGVPYLYNLPSFAGIVPGQTVNCSCITGGPVTVTSVGTVTSDVTGTNSTMSPATFIVVGSLANVGLQMAVSDVAALPAQSCTPANQIPPNAVITGILGSTITIAPPANAAVMTDCITISGGKAIGVSASPGGSGSATATVYNGLYRLVGALYTDTNSNVVGFSQDGDTFYLANSANDIKTGPPPFACAISIGNAAQSCQLSVPCGRIAATCAAPGVKVEAFGRIVGGSGDILLSSLDQNAQPPNAFPGPPGYSTNSATASTSHPFRLYTDGNGNVRVQASATSNTVYEDTDGWVMHR